MINNTILEKILFINKYKQEQLSVEVVKANVEKAQKAQEIMLNQQKIAELIVNLANYKNTAYQEKLTNNKVTIIQINQIKFDMEKMRQEIAAAYQDQERLNNEFNTIVEQIAALLEKRKSLVIKETKFEHIQQSAN
jgi:hypothetical protein